MADDPAPVQFINNYFAPEMFASTASGYAISGDNIIITFDTPRVDHSTTPGTVSRVVVLRVVMPLNGAQNLVAGLNDFLEKQGASPTGAIVGKATRQ
jgi:hypothetical protein